MPWLGDLFKWLRSKTKLKKKKNKIKVEKHMRELLSSGKLTDTNVNASGSPIKEQVVHFATYNDYVRHLQGKQIFPDVSVQIETEKYAAYRVSLASLSGFFVDIFNIQREKPHVQIRITGIKPEAFEVLLHYTYTGVLPITPEIVSDLITMADRLRIPMIKPLVNDYMETLPVAHALAIVMKEKLFGPIYDKTMIAVCEQFNTFRLEAEFLDIDIETILIILSGDNLNISSELDVFKAAVRWIEHNIMDRKQQLLRLMKCVQFHFMTQFELFQCNEFTKLLQENNECMQMILEANWIVVAWMLGKKDQLNLMVSNPRIRTRAPMLDGQENPPAVTPCHQTISGKKSPTTSDIIAIRGFVPSLTTTAISGNSMNKYQSDDNEWKHDSDLEENPSKVTPCHQTISGKKSPTTSEIITVGGFVPPSSTIAISGNSMNTYHIDDKEWKRNDDLEENPSTSTPCHQTISGEKSHTTDEIIAVAGFVPPSSRTGNSMNKYHSDDNEWKHYGDLPEPRLQFSVTIQNGRMYLTGGYDPRLKVKPPVPTADAFIFVIKTCTWMKIMPMNTARMYHSLASLNGKVYATGGTDGDIRVLNTVECYNSKTDKWLFVKPMSEARLAASTGVINGKLYTAGGYGESIRKPILDTVECFDPKKNKWKSKNKLRIPRCDANIVVVNGKLYVCGGITRSFLNHHSVISSEHSIDVYNKVHDVWEHCSDMGIARHGAGTVSDGTLIYIIGGTTTQFHRILRSVECFDTDTKTWISGVKELPYPSKWIQGLCFN
jgi:N-acetylneuraminic acid mutarotase